MAKGRKWDPKKKAEMYKGLKKTYLGGKAWKDMTSRERIDLDNRVNKAMKNFLKNKKDPSKPSNKPRSTGGGTTYTTE